MLVSRGGYTLNCVTGWHNVTSDLCIINSISVLLLNEPSSFPVLASEGLFFFVALSVWWGRRSYIHHGPNLCHNFIE